MDNQDFQDLFDAEGLYDELQDNLTSFYENFEALGQNLTKRERARRNQMYEEQMAQLEEQLSMLEEIYEVSGDSIGGLGEDFNDVLQGVRNDLKKYQVAYKRAYESVGKERDKFFEGMEESFGDFVDRRKQGLFICQNGIGVIGLFPQSKHTTGKTAYRKSIFKFQRKRRCQVIFYIHCSYSEEIDGLLIEFAFSDSGKISPLLLRAEEAEPLR